MWVFLSRRLRTWFLLVVALPLVRVIVARLARLAEHRRPGSATARVLRQSDALMQRRGRRRSRR